MYKVFFKAEAKGKYSSVGVTPAEERDTKSLLLSARLVYFSKVLDLEFLGEEIWIICIIVTGVTISFVSILSSLSLSLDKFRVHPINTRDFGSLWRISCAD